MSNSVSTHMKLHPGSDVYPCHVCHAWMLMQIKPLCLHQRTPDQDLDRPTNELVITGVNDTLNTRERRVSVRSRYCLVPPARAVCFVCSHPVLGHPQQISACPLCSVWHISICTSALPGLFCLLASCWCRQQHRFVHVSRASVQVRSRLLTCTAGWVSFCPSFRPSPQSLKWQLCSKTLCWAHN